MAEGFKGVDENSCMKSTGKRDYRGGDYSIRGAAGEKLCSVPNETKLSLKGGDVDIRRNYGRKNMVGRISEELVNSAATCSVGMAVYISVEIRKWCLQDVSDLTCVKT